MALTLRLRCSAMDLVRVRFAISPMFETREAVRLLTTGKPGSPHGRWVREARDRSAGLDLAALAALSPERGYSPDFLSPPPAGPGTAFEDELELVRDTSPTQVRAEITRSLDDRPDLPRALEWLRGDPGEALTRLADSLALAWQTLVHPTWSTTKDVLEADVAYHGRRSARHGVNALFRGLDDRLTWDDESRTLELHTRVDEERELDGAGLVLMPSSFVWPDLVAFTERPWRPTVVYPARGIGQLWSDQAHPDHAAALARLLGPRRADILLVLGSPSTTSRIARAMAMSPAAVSEHLGVLHDAGLVSRSRVGRSVEYQRTPRGSALVQD